MIAEKAQHSRVTIKPGGHLWQVGIESPGERVCDTLVCPVRYDFTSLLEELEPFAPSVSWIPGTGYAHLTLNVWARKRVVTNAERLPLAFHWQATGVEATEYGLRLRVRSAGFANVIRAFEQHPQDPYITLGYATRITTVDLPAMQDALLDILPNVNGLVTHVEHRRMAEGNQPYAPTVVYRWGLDVGR